MRKYVFIGMGGILGAVLRYWIRSMHYQYQGNVPIDTLIINITGSFLLAFILTVSLEVRDFDADLMLGITAGFLGAYTTFSTFCKEIVGLLQSGDYYSAVSYAAFSIMLGIGAAYFGALVARGVASRLMQNRGEESQDKIEEMEGEAE